jgi:hypothetical protein
MSNYSSMKNNGRVSVLEPEMDTDVLFKMYDKMPVNVPATFRDATKGVWCENNLSKAFFSKENMQIIQNGIKAGVYRKSNEQFVISNQNTDTLHIIMRSIFLQHATNTTSNITDQIRQLNTLVVEDAVPRIYSSLIAHNKYLRDVNTLPQPLDHPTLPYESKQLPRLNYGFSKEGDRRGK